MDSLSIRAGLNNYVKRLFNDWLGASLAVLLFLGMGTGLILQELKHTSSLLRVQADSIDLMNFNQQLMNGNFKLHKDIEKLNMDMYHMNEIMGHLYNRLQKYEKLPPLPSQPKNSSRNEA
jgi:hypothetical protein